MVDPKKRATHWVLCQPGSTRNTIPQSFFRSLSIADSDKHCQIRVFKMLGNGGLLLFFKLKYYTLEFYLNINYLLDGINIIRKKEHERIIIAFDLFYIRFHFIFTVLYCFNDFTNNTTSCSSHS